MYGRRLIIAASVVALIASLAMILAGCAAAAEPITAEQQAQVKTDMTRAEIEAVFGNAGSASAPDQDAVDFLGTKPSLTYRYWGDEDRWIGVGFDSEDNAADVFYPAGD